MSNVVYWVVDRRFLALAIGIARRLAPTVRPDTSLHIFLEDEGAQSFETEGVRVHANVLRPYLDRDLPSHDWPKLVWGRLFALDLLDPGVERALYLDADAFPTEALNEIFDLDMRGHAVAAVADAGFLDPSLGYAGIDFAGHGRRAGVDPAHYLNAGVLLFDRAQIAGMDFVRDITAYLGSYGAGAAYNDQDFLNHVFRDRWLELSPRWNFQVGAMLGYALEDVLRPKIFHFTDAHRPWHGRTFIHDKLHREQALRLIDNEFGADFPRRPRGWTRLRALAKDLNALRNTVLLHLGLRIRRVRRQDEVWHRRRDIFWTVIETALREGRYADVVQGLSSIDTAAIGDLRRREPVWRRTGFTTPGAVSYRL